MKQIIAFFSILIFLLSQNIRENTYYYVFGLKNESWSIKQGTNRQYYNGKEDDETLKLTHYGARFYDPAIARWTSSDPVKEFHTSYSYVGNNPTNYIDPNGMFSDWFSQNGEFLFEYDDKDNVYVVSNNEDGYTMKNIVNNNQYSDEQKNTAINRLHLYETSYNVGTKKTIYSFAALVYAESSGNTYESYAIADATMNMMTNARYSLKDFVTRPNQFSHAVGSNGYNYFLKNEKYKTNDRSALGAVFNSLLGNFDYSLGAIAWDGVDLGNAKSGHWRQTSGYELSSYVNNNYNQNVNTTYGISDTPFLRVRKFKRNSKYEYNVTLYRYYGNILAGKSVFFRAHPDTDLRLRDYSYTRFK